MAEKKSTVESQGQTKWKGLGDLLPPLAPLIGTAILYMIGWVYVSNWYSFFGVNISQLNISIPQVIIQCITPITITFITIVLGGILFYILSRFLSFARENQWWFVFGVSELLILGLVLYLYPLQLQQKLNRIFSVIIITLLVGVVLYYLLRKISSLVPKKLRWLVFGVSVSFILWLLFYFTGGLTVPGYAAATFVIALFLFPDAFIFLELNLESVQRVIGIDSFINSFPEINTNIKATIFGFFYLFTLLLLSTRLAFQLAGIGKTGVLETNNIQRVYLVGPKLLDFVPDLEKYCGTQESCIYGPFGLIAENDKSYFLIKWDINALQQTTSFTQNAGLFIIPRNNNNGSYSIMPESISIPSPTPTSTNTSTPSPVPTMTLTPLATITATSTPQPIVTITPTPTQP